MCPLHWSPPHTLHAEAAWTYIGVSKATLYRLEKNGRIRCTRLSPKGKRLFLVAELDRFLSDPRTSP